MFTTQQLFLLVPIALFLHCLEEWFLDFPSWARRRFGSITTRRFYFLSHIPIFLVVIHLSVTGAREDNGGIYILLAVAAQLALAMNGVFHLLASLLFREYSPGLVTSVVFYFPLSWVLCEQVFADRLLDSGQFLCATGIAAITTVLVVSSLTWRKVI
ncbi:MAG: HXXEE domain-containing protein [Bdellovibrionales bacterium]|nr:HXXEE domain-containing protein [Bdellovibrionales bacterium]